MFANRCYRLLLRDFAALGDAASQVLPINRRVVNRFINGNAVSFIDDLLSGIENTEQYDQYDWEHNDILGQFKEYVYARESKMKRTLAKLRYYIDQENTLTLVAGKGCPESVRTEQFVSFYAAHDL